MKSSSSERYPIKKRKKTLKREKKAAKKIEKKEKRDAEYMLDKRNWVIVKKRGMGGGNSDIYEVRRRGKRKKFIAKYIEFVGFKPNTPKWFKHEVKMQKMFARNVLAPKIIEYWCTKYYGVIISEMMDYTLEEFLRMQKVKMDDLSFGGLKYLFMVLGKIEYMNSLGLYHGDLSTDNMGVNVWQRGKRKGELKEIKFIDMGESSLEPSTRPEYLDAFHMFGRSRGVINDLKDIYHNARGRGGQKIIL
jgi:serine/threonine protein kinase